MITKEDIQKALSEILDQTEIFVTDIKIGKENAIEIRLDSLTGISIDECAVVSRKIEERFNRDQEDYSLEVSSAGLTDPFKVKQQYIKNINQQVEITPLAGEKIKGTLIFADDLKITVSITHTLRLDGKRKKVTENVDLPYAEIKVAKLILSFK